MAPPSGNAFFRLMSVYALYNAVGLVMGGIFDFSVAEGDF